MSEYSYRYAHLLDLTDNELHNWLTLKGKRPSEILAIKASIKKQKSAKRSDNAKRKRLDADWRAVINPLVNEQRVVYGMKRYNKDRYPNPERKEALDAYDALLSKLKTKLRSYHAAYERSPLQQAAWEKERLGRDIPNNGCHWTDWVPSHIRERIVVLFEAIPTTQRSKRKIPFQRMQRPRTVVKKNKAGEVVAVIHNPALTTLIKRTEKEYALALQEYEIAPTDPDREREVTLMRQALARMAKMKPNEAVPHTWHGLFKFGRSKC